ncbi:unnamed protein product, partial [Chrysoparadoxa australica]
STPQSQLSECNQLRKKLAELQAEQSEHSLVVGTLKDLDGGRKAYRLVGGVLVEHTVADVLPPVEHNMKGIEGLLARVGEQLEAKEKEAAAWKVKYGIRTQEDAEMDKQRQSRGGQGQGVLA